MKKIILTILFTVAAMATAGAQRGYYKDLFMDSTRITQVDTVIQTMLLGGNPLDENGILLYPDGVPYTILVNLK
ncbi:MAG: hypothetical protein MJY73_01005 [Bacteroidales bacterium]|nr:hypothetical protein [Bacteroidales bacterium]